MTETEHPPHPQTPDSIAGVIVAEGGRVTFARFMELALTHPTLGYYPRVDRLLRRSGDFSTAPALSPFFNHAVARLITELLDAALTATPPQAPSLGPSASPAGTRAGVIELGGGEGHAAEAVLRLWDEERPKLREHVSYRILEVGPRLRATQGAAVEGLRAKGWNVAWGSDLAAACAHTRPAVIMGNEFLDALPVHLVRVDDDGLRECHVEGAAGELREAWGPLSDAAASEAGLLFGTLDPGRLAALTRDGCLELSSSLDSLFTRLAAVMPTGSLLSIDYGEWFPGLPPTAERWGGESLPLRGRTIRGYFRHQMVSDTLARPGRQDLTADVDFAAVDLHGRRHGFETVLFTSLAAFLRAAGAEAELAALEEGTACTASDPIEADRQATVLRSLLDERDLGGAFKVMLQVKE
ncbi:MAG: hypothetical protein GX595_17880 [Lentisphaerae bacterium]|nr:hypothetical protein [Lentisphaerota bacterium]